ncbi:MAG: LysM peptidoglycan-binding domain-containing protein [Anaerolineae bacterium]
MSKIWLRLPLIAFFSVLVACVREQPNIIIITATIPQSVTVIEATQPSDVSVPTVNPTPIPQQTIVLSPIPQQPLSNPTPNATRPPVDIPSSHIVQPGDTLSLIATSYGVSLDAILNNNELENPNILSVGQEIILPDVPEQYTPNFKLIPDSRLVRGPGSRNFDIEAFINAQPGYIRAVNDEVRISIENGATLPVIETASQIVARVAREYSVDPRLLLAILEYRAGWLSNPLPDEDARLRPIVSAQIAPNADDFYNQLSWMANELNRGYYAWKYRGLVTLTLNDGTRLLFNSELNPGTIAVQYFFSLDNNSVSQWTADISLNGIYATYAQYFGDPFAGAIEPLVPNNLQQPQFLLPFENGVEWRYTGGPHGGWGSGSAWASLDFAPSEDRPDGVFCYVANAWITAVAPGVIARTGEGTVVLDLDGDGDESTGWTVMYLHLASEGMIQEGVRVNAGDRIGRPSCAGGFSNATHIHIGRRFNGEWLPADCQVCLPAYQVSSFTMGGWTTVGIAGQYYQGFMDNGTARIQAEQGLQTTINIISG